MISDTADARMQVPAGLSARYRDRTVGEVPSEIDTRIGSEMLDIQRLKSKQVKFLQVHTFYPAYLKEFYHKNPGLENRDYTTQLKTVLMDGFSLSHLFAPFMDEEFWKSGLIISNCEFLQRRWAKENRVEFKANIYETLRMQIEHYKPDILYLSDPITFDSRFVRTLSYKPMFVAGWRAASINKDTDWSCFDLLLSHLSACREEGLRRGVKAVEHFHPGFVEFIAERIKNVKPVYDIVISGQWTAQHSSRNRLIESLIKEFGSRNSIGMFLKSNPGQLTSQMERMNQGPRWGIEMFKTLRQGKIVFNAEIDLAQGEAGNMRLFETTGAGAFLLTQYHANVSQYFEPGKHLDVFRDENELFEKIRYYLSNEQKREVIARCGQEYCLKNYGMAKRVIVFSELIKKHVEQKMTGHGNHGVTCVADSYNSDGREKKLETINTEKSTKEKAVIAAGFAKDAVQYITNGEIQKGFDSLIKVKATRVPLENTDVLRAICFQKKQEKEAARQALLEELRYFPQNKIAQKMLSQMQESDIKISNDPVFEEIYRIIRPFTMLSRERLESLYRAAKEICEKNIGGNFVECGVAAGGSSAMLAAVIKRYSKQTRWLWSFDSFDGMPEPCKDDRHGDMNADESGWGTGTCAAPEESVKNLCARLGALDVLKTVKGRFEQSLPEYRNRIGIISLLHMDGDWYSSTKAILDNLYDHVVGEGFIQVDDYGYWDGCRKAMHEFEQKRNLQFSINKIDGTGVWFRRPDPWAINATIPSALVKEFQELYAANKHIESQMSLNERFALFYAVKQYTPGNAKAIRFIEIGSWAGASLDFMFRTVKGFGKPMQAIAVEPTGRPQFYEVLKLLGSEAVHLKGFSDQALPILVSCFEKDGILPEIIFIDGDHTYEGVRKDIINYYPLLAPGGLMIFHDFLPALNDENREAIFFHHGGKEAGIRRACIEMMEQTYKCEVLDLPLLYPDDPTQTQPHLPIIPGVKSTIRAYRKPAGDKKC